MPRPVLLVALVVERRDVQWVGFGEYDPGTCERVQVVLTDAHEKIRQNGK